MTGLSGTAWKDAVAALDLPFVRLATIGDRDRQDLYGDWARIREIDEAGALLVRPDGYVAWRQKAAASSSDEARAVLSATIGAILEVSVDSPTGSASRLSAPAPSRSQPRFLDATTADAEG